MRKAELFGMSREDATRFLSEAPVVSLSTTTPDGEPVHRVMNAAVWGARVVFHGAPVGEKSMTMGRSVVVSAHEIVAHVPSYFVDPERACPATTLYRSVQAHGVLEPIEALSEKTAVLQALLDKHQPERGYVPLEPSSELYRAQITSLLAFGVSLERTSGKAKLGQNRKPAERTRMLEKLWERGEPGDLRAIELVREAAPSTPLPAFLRAPEGTRLRVAPTARHARQAAELLAGTYWNDRFTKDELVGCHLGSSAWVVLLDEDDRVIASARGISDGHKRAWVYDVIVAEGRRGRGLGDLVMKALLAHPALRRARIVELGTRDAAPFYERMGFRRKSELPPRAYQTIEMALVR